MPRSEAGVSKAVLEVAERYAKKHPDGGLWKLSRGRRKHKERKENAMSDKKKPAASRKAMASYMPPPKPDAHSPLPWEVSKNAYGSKVFIEDASGEAVCVALEHNGAREVAEANAAFIVKLANSRVAGMETDIRNLADSNHEMAKHYTHAMKTIDRLAREKNRLLDELQRINNEAQLAIFQGEWHGDSGVAKNYKKFLDWLVKGDHAPVAVLGEIEPETIGKGGGHGSP